MKKQARKPLPTGDRPKGSSGPEDRLLAARQYTVRNVPAHVDSALRRKARAEGKSLNHVLREALAREAGVAGGPEILHHDLDGLAGQWVEDAEFDRALAGQDRVDESLWK